MNTASLRTTVSVRMDTKARMDKWRAPGQCYDGFLCQIVELWEKMHCGNRIQKPASDVNKSTAIS
jgi:hypothetical protein